MKMSLSEKFTEFLTTEKMQFHIGENDFGYVFPQGDVKNIKNIEARLKQAGGKPKNCDLSDYSISGKGSAKPEYIITFNDNKDYLIIIECKKALNKHESEELNKPKDYAVDGVLYYAKYLKEDYNIFAIAVSGTNPKTFKSSTFFWRKKSDNYEELTKLSNDLLSPNNYLNFIKGKAISKKYSLEEIRLLSLEFHKKLRKLGITEKQKPLFIAGILIALQDETFTKEYKNFNSFHTLFQNLKIAIRTVLKKIDLEETKINNLINVFDNIEDTPKFEKIPLLEDNSIYWYISELEMKIKPMMNDTTTTIDALGVFYHEFIKYAGGDGKGLGIVLTPQHLTEFMVELAEIDRNTKVLDSACGSGSFLVTAMQKMIKDTGNPDELNKIKKENIFGVEINPDLYLLSVTNMIIRGDGKSNLIHGDSFDKDIREKLKKENINVGLLNPPYSQKDDKELDFVENLLDILVVGGKGVVVVPLSCAIGTENDEHKQRLLRNHTLKAVFTMPADIFYPTSTNVCVMVWEAHKPHNSERNTFFGHYTDDGFQKRKKLGRIDVNNTWDEIKKSWLSYYHNKETITEKTVMHKINANDEWLCEAYMETDYNKLTQKDFQNTINEYLASKIKNEGYYES